MSYIVRRYKVGIKRFRKYDNSYTRTNFITTSPRERSDPNLITNKFRNPAKHELFQMKGLFSDPFPRSPTQPTSPLDFTICSQIAQSSFHFVGQLVTRLSDLWFFPQLGLFCKKKKRYLCTTEISVRRFFCNVEWMWCCDSTLQAISQRLFLLLSYSWKLFNFCV